MNDPRRSFLFSGLLLATLLHPPSAPVRAQDGPTRFEQTEILGMLEMPVSADLTTLTVPLDHFAPLAAGNPAGATRTIELAVARFSTDHSEPGPPIYFLAGGPGGSGVDGAAITATHPQVRLLEHSDVIGFDQRGTGRSRPLLTDMPENRFSPFAPSPDQPMTRARYVELLRLAVRTFHREAAEQGTDLAAFDAAQSVEDLDAVRRTLGHARIVLYGASYGTHLGLAYLRRYPEHVERAVFLHVEGPDHTWKLPSTAQEVLELVADRHARRLGSGETSLTDRLQSVLAALARNPILVEDADKPGRPWAIGDFEVRAEIAARLGSVREIETIPTLLDALEQGDGSGVVEMARELRRPFVHPLLVAMDCASGSSKARRARIERERRDPQNLLQDAILLPVLPDVCDEIHDVDLGNAFRAAPTSDVPILMVSGDLDGRTPPSNVDALLPGLSAVTHVLVENASHDLRQLMAPEFRAILQRFLRGESLPSTTLRLPPPLFERADSEEP